MTGRLCVVGLGPGPSRWITPEATSALEEATDILGYFAYVSRIQPRDDQRVHGSDNGDELSRAREALDLAGQGSRVAIVSGGDPGVFAMAAAVFEAIELGPEEWRAIDVHVLPGVTAMLAAAARLGAPLGNDFCAINLSDNLKPWATIESRLIHASLGDFVLSLYNPASRARPSRIHDAFRVLREHRPSESVVVLAKAVGRPDEEIELTTLGEVDPGAADMRTLVIIGATTTRTIRRESGEAWVYSPRSLDGVTHVRSGR